MQPQPFNSQVILSNSMRTPKQNKIVLGLLTAINDMLELENDEVYVQKRREQEESIHLPKYSNLKWELIDLMNKIGNYYLAGDYDKTSLHIKQALSLHENADAYFHKGLISMHKNKFYDTIRSYTEAIIMFPEYHRAYYMRANLLFDMLELHQLFNDPQIQLCVKFIKRDLEMARSFGLSEAESLLVELNDKLDEEGQDNSYLNHVRKKINNWFK